MEYKSSLLNRKTCCFFIYKLIYKRLIYKKCKCDFTPVKLQKNK